MAPAARPAAPCTRRPCVAPWRGAATHPETPTLGQHAPRTMHHAPHTTTQHADTRHARLHRPELVADAARGGLECEAAGGAAAGACVAAELHDSAHGPVHAVRDGVVERQAHHLVCVCVGACVCGCARVCVGVRVCVVGAGGSTEGGCDGAAAGFGAAHTASAERRPDTESAPAPQRLTLRATRRPPATRKTHTHLQLVLPVLLQQLDVCARQQDGARACAEHRRGHLGACGWRVCVCVCVCACVRVETCVCVCVWHWASVL
jgi:hypothetical protein